MEYFGGLPKLIFAVGGVDSVDCLIQLSKDPAVEETALCWRVIPLMVFLDCGKLLVAEDEGIPNLVAELSVAFDDQDIQVDTTRLDHVGQQTEAQSIGTAFWDPLGEVQFLLFERLFQFVLGEVSILEFLKQLIQGSSFNDFQRINNVALRFGHLLTVLIAHNWMQIYSLEGQFVGEPKTHHDHTCYPEEQDIVAGFENTVGEELLEVGMLCIGPFQHREGE